MSASRNAEIELTVVGTSHYQKDLKRLAGKHGDEGVRLETTATLVPEPDNPYDENAVKVLIENKLVGHLSADDAEEYSERLQELAARGGRVTCSATIIGGRTEKGRVRNQKLNYGVRVWVTDPDEIPIPEQSSKKGGRCSLAAGGTLVVLVATGLIIRHTRTR